MNSSLNWRFRLMPLLGGVALLLVACGEPAPTPKPTAPPPTEAVVASVPNAQAAQQAIAPPQPVAATAGATATPTPGVTTITPCAAPPGWVEYTIQPGDTLTGLALASGATVIQLIQANCLADDVIRADATLYLPVALHLTPTPCSVKAGWPVYSVQPGDTLSGLAAATGSNVEELQAANCLSDTIIRLSQPLYLPRLPAVRTTGTGVDSTANAGAAPLPAPVAPNGAAPSGVVLNRGADVEDSDGSGAGGGGGGLGGLYESPFGGLTEGLGVATQPPDPNGDDSCDFYEGDSFRVAAHQEGTLIDLGEHQYFYACDAAPGLITATVNRVGYTNGWLVPVFPTPPNPTFAMDNPHAAAVVSGLPWMQTDTPYQIVMEDSAGQRTAPLKFEFRIPDGPRILTVPPVIYRTGMVAEVYLIDYPFGDHTVKVFAGYNPENCATGGSLPHTQITVTTNQPLGENTWGRYRFRSTQTDPPGGYILCDLLTDPGRPITNLAIVAQ